MNAEFNKDVNNIVDRKIQEIFQNYLSGYQKEESDEEKKMFSQIKELSDKIDNLTELSNKIIYIVNNGVTINTDIKEENKKQTKMKEKLFIPDIDTTDMIIANKNKSKVIRNDMGDTLSALNNLK